MEAWMEIELIKLKWLEAEARAMRRATVEAVLVVLILLLAIGGTIAYLLSFI